jgi:hypothetical protein
MKRFTIAFVLIALLGMQQGFAQLKTPAASPSMSFTQEIGISQIKVTYARPGVKGRKIFGDFIPWGEVWRTGANASTTLEFADEVSLNGNKVPAGKYALFTIPGKDAWTVIISGEGGWGAMGYNPEKDVVRFQVTPQKTAQLIETFTIDFQEFKGNGATMVLAWENTQVPIQVEMDVDTQVMARLNQLMKNPENSLAGLYYQAAAYYFDTNRDPKQALEWINKSLSYDPNPYWVLRLKSRIQARMNDWKGAVETAKVSMEKAEQAGNQEYVRLNKEAIAEWQKKK